MTTVTLKQMVNENKGKQLKMMNVAFLKFAKEHGIDLFVESNFHYCEREEEMVQAVEVDENIEKVFALLGATMLPTVKEIDEMYKRKEANELFDITVEIQTQEAMYEVRVFEDNLHQTSSIWMDTNELKEKRFI